MPSHPDHRCETCKHWDGDYRPVPVCKRHAMFEKWQPIGASGWCGEWEAATWGANDGTTKPKRMM